MKKCSKCNIQKSLDQYHNRKAAVDGKRNECKDCLKKWKQDYYKVNSEHVKKTCLEYRLNNKEKVKKFKREYENRRILREPIYAKLCRARKLLYKVFTCGKISDATCLELFGGTKAEYRIYMYGKFSATMRQNNYGNYWVIDHIRPLSSFNLSNEEDFKAAFHYTNTQPLPQAENLKKANKWNEAENGK